MGGRLALVVGSECAALGELRFTGELAAGLYARLTEDGGWQSATSAAGPLLDPTVPQLVMAVDEAFAAAAEQQATLLLGFIGHGMATSAEDFYLLCTDSPSTPDSHNAFHLTQAIRERLNRATPDGLIVLVDACDTAQGVLGAARRWTDLLVGSAGRMELLVAAGDGPAYAGCFTRTMLATFETGLRSRGENVLPSDLVEPIAEACTRQQPQHLSFSSGSVAAHNGDPGLWLVPNVARGHDAVTGRPAAGFVDQLTRGLLLTPAVLEALASIVASGGHRLRGVIGPPGAGKSTLLAMLIRPSLVDALPVAPEYITAAVFLTVNSSMESVAVELSVQLSARLPGFGTAVRAVRENARRGGAERDVFDIEVCQPLARLASGRRVTLVIDGLNQPQEGTRQLLLAAIADLTLRDELRHVRVIVGIREGTEVENDPGLSHMHRILVVDPEAEDIATIVESSLDQPVSDEAWISWIDELLAEAPGVDADESRPVAAGWLLARLLHEVAADLTDRAIAGRLSLDGVVTLRVGEAVRVAGPRGGRAIGALLAVLVAAGVGPVLPIGLFDAAIANLGVVESVARLRDLTVSLGSLVTRSRPGTVGEMLGVTHVALVAGLTAELRRLGMELDHAHRAISAAIEADTSARAVAYARGAAPRHYLAYGDSASAFDFLTSLETPRAAHNRDLWSAWLPTFLATVGPEHRDSFRVRNRVSNCLGRCGDINTAIWLLEELSTEQAAVLGAGHVDSLCTRFDIADWRGHTGQLALAVAELDHLVADYTRVLGPDDVWTLRARSSLAYWRSERGSVGRAIADLEQLIVDESRILGASDPESLRTRHHLARCRGMAGDFEHASAEFAELLADQTQVLGPDHLQTLRTRNSIARWRHEAGDAARAGTDYAALLADQLRILGPDHPDALHTRNSLASCHGETGAIAQAIGEYERLLTDLERVFDTEHPFTMLTRRNLAYWRARLSE